MAVVNPCVCMPLQKGCKILSIIDAVISMIRLGLMILALIAYIRHDDLDLTEKERKVGIIIVCVFIVICILQILLAYRLYYGATRRNYRQCKTWIILTLISTCINIGSLTVNVSASDFEGFSFGGSIASIFYNIYEMIVVYAFLKELRRDSMFSNYVITAHSEPNNTQNYLPGDADTTVYVIPAGQPQNAYPMQQFSSVNPSYPPTVQHVTTRIS